MTDDTLAAARAAIERDRETEAGNWPLARDRTRLYLALAEVVAEWVQADIDSGALWPEGDDFADTETRAIYAALAALAEDTEQEPTP